MKMTILSRRFTLVLGLFYFTILGYSQTSNSIQAPNVILIICDDLNDAVHGLGGHPQAITPSLDKLAEEGIRFTNAQCNAPLCGPSRASLWSGLYPHTTGYFGYNQQKNHWRDNETLSNTVTIFEHFANNGYQVYASGKIHHNGHEDKSIFLNEDGSSGFKVDASFGPYPWDSDPETATLQIRGVRHPDFPAHFQDFRWSEGFGAVRDISEAFDGKGAWLYDHWGKEFKISNSGERDLMPDERCTEYALSVISDEHERPFILTIGYNRPHSPQYVPKKYFDKYGLDTLMLSPSLQGDIDDCAPKTLAAKDIHGVNTGRYKYNRIMEAGGESLLKRWTRAYLASVTFVDDQIGQVLTALKQSKYSENTIVIVTSDHGYHMGEKELIFKNTTWEESARIPMLVAGPGLAENMECTTPVSLIDLYPTLVDYCHLPASPNGSRNGAELDGYSMLPLLKSPEVASWDGPDFALTAVCSQQELAVNQAGSKDQQQYSLRSERYRYIRYRNGEEEFYDHRYDPYEWYNLADDHSYDDIMNSYLAKLNFILEK